jgi:hypothetical protein
MFFPGSRYISMTAYQFANRDGTVVQVTKIPLPRPAVLVGYYKRLNSQRLDLIANNFLADATAFWQLCDANNAVVPDALANRTLVGIPLNAPVA